MAIVFSHWNLWWIYHLLCVLQRDFQSIKGWTGLVCFRLYINEFDPGCFSNFYRLFPSKIFLNMENITDAKLLRIFIGESDKIGHDTLYETIVIEAKKQGLSGATVTRGIMGFGANSKIHTSKLLELSSDLPLVIEIVDSEEKIRAFTQTVKHLFEQAKSGGLITLEKVEIIKYTTSN